MVTIISHYKHKPDYLLYCKQPNSGFVSLSFQNPNEPKLDLTHNVDEAQIFKDEEDMKPVLKFFQNILKYSNLNDIIIRWKLFQYVDGSDLKFYSYKIYNVGGYELFQIPRLKLDSFQYQQIIKYENDFEYVGYYLSKEQSELIINSLNELFNQKTIYDL